MSVEYKKNSEKPWRPHVRMNVQGLSALVKASPLGTLAIDLDGRILFWNKALEDISGWREEEVLGKSFEVIAADHLDHYEELRRRTLKLEVIHSLPMNARNKDGTNIIISYSAAPIVDYKSRIVGTMAVLCDITENMKLEAALNDSLEKMARVVDETVSALSAAVEKRDPYTAGHQRRVAELACAIAGAMGSLGDDRIKGIRTAAMIHDIGKLYVPSELLTKPGQLTDIEFELVKTHSQAGYEILQGIEFPWPIAQIVQQHHERLDGSGYPLGLTGDEILLEAHIIAVADAVEAMSSYRPYRPGKGIEPALQEIINGRGRRYDSLVVDACMTLFRSGFVLSEE